MDMPAEDIKLFEDELQILFQKAYGSGLSYWEILKVILHQAQQLQMLADAEYWAKREE